MTPAGLPSFSGAAPRVPPAHRKPHAPYTMQGPGLCCRTRPQDLNRRGHGGVQCPRATGGRGGTHPHTLRWTVCAALTARAAPSPAGHLGCCPCHPESGPQHMCSATRRITVGWGASTGWKRAPCGLRPKLCCVGWVGGWQVAFGAHGAGTHCWAVALPAIIRLEKSPPGAGLERGGHRSSSLRNAANRNCGSNQSPACPTHHPILQSTPPHRTSHTQNWTTPADAAHLTPYLTHPHGCVYCSLCILCLIAH